MAETFPVSGSIEPDSFPHLLVDLHRHGATGSLKVNGPTYPKQLFFRAGRILFGSSNDPKDHLGTILIESGRITRQQFDEVNSRLSPGNPLAKVLEESGFVNRREINEAARTKVERILADILTWPAGSFEFEDGVLPKGAVDLKLSTERLLLEATRRITDRGFALRHVGMETVLEPASGSDGALAEVQADVAPLLERLDGRRSLGEAIALTRLDEFEAAKTACALLFLGIVQKKEGSKEVDLAEEAQSGLAAEEAPPAPAPEPVYEATGFALSEPEVPSFPAVEPEPERVVGAAETVAFVPPQPEPEPFVVPEPAPEPLPETLRIEPLPAEPASFATKLPWARKPSDTVPGDEPAYVPPQAPVKAPPPPSAEAPPVPDIAPPPAPPSRPTREDLVALDALLSPSASSSLGRSPVERPAPPPSLSQPHHRPPTTPSPRSPARIAAAGRTRVPFIAIILGSVLLTTVAAWYFFLRSPESRVEVASAKATPAPVAAPEAPTPGPTATPAVEPTATPAAAATPAATPPPTPRPTPSPATRPTPPPPTSTAGPAPLGEARSLLARGALPDAARAFAASMSPEARGSFSYQVLVACDPANVQKAVTAVPGDELFILPVNVKGKACYRLCWGVYADRPAAEAAASGLPPYFRQGGAVPRLSPLAELLP